jgi:hypothetical protein
MMNMGDMATRCMEMMGSMMGGSMMGSGMMLFVLPLVLLLWVLGLAAVGALCSGASGGSPGRTLNLLGCTPQVEAGVPTINNPRPTIYGPGSDSPALIYALIHGRPRR